MPRLQFQSVTICNGFKPFNQLSQDLGQVAYFSLQSPYLVIKKELIVYYFRRIFIHPLLGAYYKDLIFTL